MATTVTVPTPNIHWLLYPLLVAGLLFGIWLWRDTAAKDFKAIQAVVESVKDQKAVDKQAVAQTNAANEQLKNQNAALEKQLARAKTTQKLVALINQNAGTKIEAPVSSVPDAPITIKPPDLQQLAVSTIECAEDKNQVAVDQLKAAATQQQLEARDQTIKDQGKEITQLKGGSHLKRFLKAAKYVGIGTAIGVGIGIAVEKK